MNFLFFLLILKILLLMIFFFWQFFVIDNQFLVTFLWDKKHFYKKLENNLVTIYIQIFFELFILSKIYIYILPKI